MSRIGKNPIAIPAGVDVQIDGQNVTVKGPKGTLSHVVAEPITATVNEGQVVVERPNDERSSRSLHGLSRTLIANMIVGVTEGYKKDLEITGTGYRVVAKGKDLEFSLGFSHTITVTPPEGIEFTIAPKSQTLFTVSGIDKQLVGETAARIRKLKKPEPYKGKFVARKRRHLRLRKKINGTPERPRLVVTRSNRHMVAQVIDDTVGHTLVSASDIEAELAGAEGTKTDKARKVGALIAERAKAAGISAVVFDRGGNKYTGRVAAVAEAAREGGLEL